MSNATTKALEMLTAITAGREFNIPDVDLSGINFQFPSAEDMYQEVEKLSIADLTTRTVNGDGVFDALMESVNAHVRTEYEKGRITGAEYSKTYIAAMQAAMGSSVQFLLSKDAAYWQAQQAQLQAITARIEFETAKVRHALMFIEANTAEANFALTATRLANEEINYNTGIYNLEQMLPVQKALADEQVTSAEFNNLNMLPAQLNTVTTQNSINAYQLSDLLPTEKLQLLSNISSIDAQTALSTHELTSLRPVQLNLLTEQVEGQTLQNSTTEYGLLNTLPQQLKNLEEQETLLHEQMEVQRAQTQELRSDNLPVLGSLGKQKELYSQQITSYQRDAEVKAAKIFTDAWITQKTIDEGLVPPDAFANASLQTILENIKINNNLS